MKTWLITLIIGIVFALSLYLFIMWVKRETNKFNEEKHKPEPMFNMRVLK